jgi:MSHA biogenesis protein MshN
MSVINQMLKDLDKRQNEQQNAANLAISGPTKNSNTKLIIVIVTVIIILNVAGILGWQLYSENQQLRMQVQQETMRLAREQSLAATKKNKISVTKLAEIKAPMAMVASSLPSSSSSPSPNLSPKDSSTLASNLQQKNENKSKSNNIAAKITEKNTVAVKPLQLQVADNYVEPEPVNETLKAKSSLTISRRQLSPQALAANKISEAEQAMERNNLAKAEALFEEVLLVMPEHETARKQLAALWYGKKAYRDAINLLSQGIALAPPAQEMRLMSARIYYQQGQARQAYNILQPIKASNSAEIQTLLANTSAELNEHNSAITAYRKLITLEPDVGRWWLGVAVSLDSQGNFLPARDAYKQAIARNNLSSSAMKFARERLIELGE